MAAWELGNFDGWMGGWPPWTDVVVMSADQQPTVIQHWNVCQGERKIKEWQNIFQHFPANILLVNNRWQSFSMLIYNKINSYKMIVNLCCETCNSEWTVRSCWNKLSSFFFVFFQRKNESSWWNSKQLERSKNHSRCTRWIKSNFSVLIYVKTLTL